MWPSTPDEFELFAVQVSDLLARQGFCIVECISGERLREDALKQAQELPGYFGPKPELLVDFLGKGGSGKVAYLGSTSENALADAPYPDVLHRLDDELGYLSQALAVLAPEQLGFNCAGRHKTQVWMPCENRQETMRLRGEPITEQDVEDGVVERHLAFIRQRKVGFMRMVDNEGGHLSLIPREDISDLHPVKLPVSPNKLLVYRADYMTFSYKPRPLTKSLVLQSWLLEEPPQVKLSSLIGGMDHNAETIGIKGESIPPPCGDRIHLMSMATRLPGETHNSDEGWNMFSSGVDAFVHIPASRWDTNLYCTELGGEKIMGMSYCRHSSLCNDDVIFNMDNDFFGIPDDEVIYLSPSHRTILEEGYNCLYNYGYTKKTLRGRNIPVYVGDTGSDFSPQISMSDPRLIAKGKHMGESAWLGASPAMTCSRLSCCLGLTGAASAIDTACSASLVAVQVEPNTIK
jgi:polyketide synthase-associated protein